MNMKKKVIQTLVFINSRQQQSVKFDSSNIYHVINQLPEWNMFNLQQSAKEYATAEMQNSYGIRVPEPMTKQEISTTQEILNRIQEIKRTKSIRLAGFIERINQKMSFQELQEARQFLQALDGKEVKQLSFNLDLLQSVVNQKLQRENEFVANHTIDAAISLIQQLQKVKKTDQL